MTVYNYFYFRGTQLGLAGAGGVIVTTLNPIITSLLAVIIFKDILKSKDVWGAVLGLTGGAFIIKIWSVNYFDLVQNGNIHFLLASTSWAFVTLITASSKNKIHQALQKEDQLMQFEQDQTSTLYMKHPHQIQQFRLFELLYL